MHVYGDLPLRVPCCHWVGWVTPRRHHSRGLRPERPRHMSRHSIVRLRVAWRRTPRGPGVIGRPGRFRAPSAHFCKLSAWSQWRNLTGGVSSTGATEIHKLRAHEGVRLASGRISDESASRGSQTCHAQRGTITTHTHTHVAKRADHAQRTLHLFNQVG